MREVRFESKNGGTRRVRGRVGRRAALAEWRTVRIAESLTMITLYHYNKGQSDRGN